MVTINYRGQYYNVQILRVWAPEGEENLVAVRYRPPFDPLGRIHSNVFTWDKIHCPD